MSRIVSEAEWLEARREFLKKEREFTHLRDQLSRERRELPWTPVEKPYIFEGPNGKLTLPEMFKGLGQLEIYHFMMAPGDGVACKSCSFWADNFNGIPVHLAHRDTAFAAISRAPYEEIAAYKERMGWSFDWYSSYGTDFNYDYQVSFKPAETMDYNFEEWPYLGEDMPGVTVFAKDESGKVYRTYSTYARGIDILNGAYNYLDLTPKGRDEDQYEFSMQWLPRHDEY